MKFVLDYSDGGELSSSFAAENAVNALIKYAMERLDNENQLSFCQTLTYLNIAAREQNCVFEYFFDEPKHTEGFTLTAKEFLFGKSQFSKKALLLAPERFPDLQIRSEAGRVVIRGTAELF